MHFNLYNLYSQKMGQIQTALAMELSEAPAALRERAALVDGPSGTFRGFSFAQLERFTGLLACGLRERCGIGKVSGSKGESTDIFRLSLSLFLCLCLCLSLSLSHICIFIYMRIFFYPYNIRFFLVGGVGRGSQSNAF